MKSFVPKAAASAMTQARRRHPAPGLRPPAAAVEGDAAVISECAEKAPLPEPADAPESTHQPRNAEVNFHGQKRANATHISTTDAGARLYRIGQGKEAKLSYLGHTLMENRTGVIVVPSLTAASGYAEREAALAMISAIGPAGGV
jgi:hypothetical protein